MCYTQKSLTDKFRVQSSHWFSGVFRRYKIETWARNGLRENKEQRIEPH